MSRFYSHVNTAKSILGTYSGQVPFSVFLKAFFAKEKKFGSRDRKNISSFCYSYFRLGYAFKEQSIDERLMTALFLSTDVSIEWLQKEKPEWVASIALSLKEKIRVIGLNLKTVFPFADELSQGIDLLQFNLSFLIQPDLFVRVRPGKMEAVETKLHNSQINFSRVNESCLAFANGTKLDDVLEINKEAVIQDLNSQRVAEFFPMKERQSWSVWDCCAASGGKAIMAHDYIAGMHLTVSDIRQTIIQNLHSRFKEAGIRQYKSFVADLVNPESLQSSLQDLKFDLIICDAPCSGSGTWSRTPEEMVFFKQEEITRYSNLQKSIATNTIRYLNKGGYLLYITCSVFKKENEEVVDFLQQAAGLELIKMELLKGYDVKADTMFSALFKL
ncbi:Fmu (Sun) domain-containing protein [Segetibacter aerophilus]|uniref:RNA methyltransferase n=1 Tax=Segetibacter aerophilus TaxID=670293 RepID=A0A512B7L1_9BACT|nr:Fmu (Sun) domain-containing protein [Segetibacter aerophilus]GEO07951.1 RNA methyltransferase [Segetibacter aerophilus]